MIKNAKKFKMIVLRMIFVIVKRKWTYKKLFLTFHFLEKFMISKYIIYI